MPVGVNSLLSALLALMVVTDYPLRPARVLSARLVWPPQAGAPFGPYHDVGPNLVARNDDAITSLMVHLECERQEAGRDFFLAWLVGPDGRQMVGQGGAGGMASFYQVGFGVLCQFATAADYVINVTQAGTESRVAAFAFHVTLERDGGAPSF